MPLYSPKFGPNQGNLKVYLSQGHDQVEPFKDSRLKRADDTSKYEIWTFGLKGPPTSSANGRTPGPPRPPGSSAWEDPIHRIKDAFGWYDFVIPATEPSVAYVRRSSFAKREHGKRDPGSARGHNSIAKQGSVIFAGELLFGGDLFAKSLASDAAYKKTKAGQLIRWTNKTGHYYVGAQQGMSYEELWEHVSEQTELLKTAKGSRLLPMDLFEKWDGDI